MAKAKALYPDKVVIAAAERIHGDEGTLEVDDNAKVSRGTDADGCYVQAWVWVYYSDVNKEDHQ
jgi:hypothetical protein